MKQFRLLRNNKESGPYDAEQLIQIGLKAYDLVWEDGRSAAWRYPSEIADLKAFAPAVEDQPFDRFYKRNEENINAVADTIIAAVKKEKPRFRIKADWKKIEQPLLVAETKQIETKQTPQPVFAKQNISAEPQPSWHDAWLDWEQEKKAVTSTNKTTVSQNVIHTKVEVPLETKFSQSLNDIKERYVESILKPCEKRSLPLGTIFKKGNIAAALLIGLIGWGIYVGFVMKDPDAKNTAAAVKSTPVKAPQTVVIPPDVSDNTDAASQPVNNDDINNNATTIDNNNKLVAVNKNNLPKPVKNKIISATAIPKHISLQQKNNSVVKKVALQNISPVYKQASLSSAKNIVVKNNQTAKPPSTFLPGEHSAVVQQSNGQYTRTVARRTDNNIIASNPQPAKVSATNTNYTTPVSAKKRIEDYVTVSNANGPSSTIQNMHLSVQNNTDNPIDLAVVDIQYFDANGRFQKGETVYVNDIPANENIDVKVPDSRSSSHINYKVSLVSSAQKTLVAE
jgi:hypothetical protein